MNVSHTRPRRINKDTEISPMLELAAVFCGSLRTVCCAAGLSKFMIGVASAEERRALGKQ